MKQNFKKGGFSRFFIILCKVHEKFLLWLMFHFLNFFNCFLGILTRMLVSVSKSHRKGLENYGKDIKT
ncbi:hypothetical protein [Helicobacter pylori]|uniref:hypothetical protein n=1 Tax=Helicobacter pylori TaxID=210 RepID=UPI000FDCE4CD|nr:hypothetical protein [Helicobacter pylori]RVZ89286.1 hypothetical protein EDA74_07195 [Helicobacter pylori]